MLRYDTEDLVETIAGPLTCNLKHWPATTDLLGKLRLSVRGPQGWIHPRQIREALEAVEDVPLPARCGFWPVAGGVEVEVLVRETDPILRHKIWQRLEEQSVPVRELHLVQDAGQLQHALPLRCDLREALFDSRSLFQRPAHQP